MTQRYLLLVRMAYSRAVVTHSVPMTARRVLSATIAVMLLALVWTQAATAICSAQCAESSSASSPAMAHCQAMQTEQSQCASLEGCPASHSICAVDLLADSQGKVPTAPTSSADLGSHNLAPVPTSADASVAIVPLRSSIGSPPLITPIRV
jgi:hypothetical protein